MVKTTDRNVMRFCGKVRKALLVRQVAWNMITLPKQEGGLGLKKLKEWNVVVILRNIWCLFLKSGSLCL